MNDPPHSYIIHSFNTVKIDVTYFWLTGSQQVKLALGQLGYRTPCHLLNKLSTWKPG